MLRFLAIGLLALVLSLLSIFALALFPLGLYGGVLTGRSSTTGLCDKPWAQEAQLGLCLASAWLSGEQVNSPEASGAQLLTHQPQSASSEGSLATTRRPSPEAGSLPGTGQAGGIGANSAFLVGPQANGEGAGLWQDAGEGDNASHGGDSRDGDYDHPTPREGQGSRANYAPYSAYGLREKDLVKIQKPLRWLKEGGGLVSRDGASETNTPLQAPPSAAPGAGALAAAPVPASPVTGVDVGAEAGVVPDTDGADDASIINDLEDSRQARGARQPPGKKRRPRTSPSSHSSISSVDSDDSPTEVEKILARKLEANPSSGGRQHQ